MSLWKTIKENPKKSMGVLAIIIFVVFFALGRSAEAAEARLGLGFGVSGNEGARYQEMMLTTNDLRWYGAVTFIGGDNRHDYQYRRFTIGYRVNWRRATNFSPYLRLGTAYFDKEPTDYISDKWAFDMAIGMRLWNILELEIVQHNSTAGRSNQNEGLNAPMFSVVLPFGK